MAKFCAYCGTPLEEGAVCACRAQATPVQETQQPQQAAPAQEAQAETAATAAPVAPTPVAPQPQVTPVNPAPYPQGTQQQAYQPNMQGMPVYQQPAAAKPAFDFNGLINTIIKTVAGIFAKPKTTAKEFVESKNFIAGIIMVGLNTILSAMFALVFFAKLNGALEAALGIFGGTVKFPIFKIFVVTFVFSAILSAAFFGLNALIGVIFKENYDVKAALCVTGIRSIVCVPFNILAILLCLINPTVGVVLYVISALVAVIFVQQALSNVLVKTAQYQVYINVGICLIMLIVFYVLARIGLNVYMPEGITDLLGYMM